MTVLDIVLIIIGILFIVISCVISEKVSEEKRKMDSVQEVWTNKEELTIKDRVENIVSDRSEMIINDTEERLCHISNDKIMEFKEYSDQVSAKLEDDHKQAVFLYNLLNEKQSEMKEWINQLDKKRTETEDYLNKAQADLQQTIDNAANTMAVTKSAPVIRQSAANASQVKSLISSRQGTTVKPQAAVPKPAAAKASDMPALESSAETKNDKILRLWNEGRSILEISKHLGIGQGEVKLVVDLFKGA